VLNLLLDKGFTQFSIAQLDRYMKNVGNPQFSYDVFKAAYDQDTRIQNLVKDFDGETIELKTSELDDVKISSKEKNRDTVGKMAKRAVDLKDL
jgi:hypothetical protein